MTYQEIRTALKSFQAQGQTIPPLNSKREVLENALIQLQQMTAAAEVAIDTPQDIPPSQENTLETLSSNDSSASTPEPPTITIETPKTVVSTELAIPSVETIATTFIAPEHPAVTELRELAKVAEWLLIWGVTLIRSFIRFSTPYLVRAGENALRAAVYGAVAIDLYIKPKLLLTAYSFGIWGLSLVLKTSRKGSIA